MIEIINLRNVKREYLDFGRFSPGGQRSVDPSALFQKWSRGIIGRAYDSELCTFGIFFIFQ